MCGGVWCQAQTETRACCTSLWFCRDEHAVGMHSLPPCYSGLCGQGQERVGSVLETGDLDWTNPHTCTHKHTVYKRIHTHKYKPNKCRHAHTHTSTHTHSRKDAQAHRQACKLLCFAKQKTRQLPCLYESTRCISRQIKSTSLRYMARLSLPLPLSL